MACPSGEKCGLKCEYNRLFKKSMNKILNIQAALLPSTPIASEITFMFVGDKE